MTTAQAWNAKLGPVSGDLYIMGLQSIASTNYTGFLRLDSSDNPVYSVSYVGYPRYFAWEIDSKEQQMFTLIRVNQLEINIFKQQTVRLYSGLSTYLIIKMIRIQLLC